MNQGEIYEQGTLEQIFEHPQRERTRRFIKKLKAFEEHITSWDLDFIGINMRLEKFSRSNLMNQKTIAGTQRVFEELCVQTIVLKQTEPDMKVTVEYSEMSGHAQMRIYYSGGFDAL